MILRLLTAMLLAGVALYSCGSDETPLQSGGENDDPSEGAGSPLAGFDIPAELSQWAGLNPFEGSGYTLRGFPDFLVTIGGPGKDGIPALNNPPFVAPEEVLDEIPLTAYDESCTTTDLDTLVGRLAE